MIYFTILYLVLHVYCCLSECIVLWLWFFIALGGNSYTPLPYRVLFRFTLLILPILVIQWRIASRDLLCSWFVLCVWRCLLPVLWIAGQLLSPSLSLSSEYWMSFSMALDDLSFLWLALPLSPLAGLLVERPLHSDGLCTLNFPRHFPLISLPHPFHAVSFHVLILGSLSSDLMFLFSHIGFSLKSLPFFFLVLDRFLLWYPLIVLILRFWISTCRARIFCSFWEGAFHYPFNYKNLNLLSAKIMKAVGFRSYPSSKVSSFLSMYVTKTEYDVYLYPLKILFYRSLFVSSFKRFMQVTI